MGVYKYKSLLNNRRVYKIIDAHNGVDRFLFKSGNGGNTWGVRLYLGALTVSSSVAIPRLSYLSM